MANYMGLVFCGADEAYGTDQFKKNRKPRYYLKNDSQSPDLNIQDMEVSDARNGLDEYRVGYPEPEGETSLTAHTKSAPTLFRALLNNYKFTSQAVDCEDGTKLNMHEFWAGENLEVPEWNAEFTYGDFMLKRVFGGLCDSMEWTAGLEKTEVDFGFIYKDEAVKEIDLETYRTNFPLLKALPLVGYDYEVAILPDNQELTSSCFKEVKITVENNHVTGDDARCLGAYTYGFKPTMESRNIELEMTTKFDRRNFQFIVSAMHNKYEPNSDGFNRLYKCEQLTGKIVLKAKPCIDGNEYVKFTFPKCKITLDPIDADSGNVEATLKAIPYTTEEVVLNDNTTHKITPMLVQIASDSPKVE